MSLRMLAGPALAWLLLGATAAHAQGAPRATDVGPPPAEERDSAGAVVLEKSLVRAQRSNTLAQPQAATGVGTAGRGLVRATLRARTRSDLASARAAEAADLHQRGAGTLTAR